MKYALLLHFLMISIGCFATNAQEYHKEDKFYKVYWAQKQGAWVGIDNLERKSIYAHATCTLNTLRKYLNIASNFRLAIYEKDRQEQTNANNSAPLIDNLEIWRYFSPYAVVKDNKSELKGKKVFTPGGIMEFDELLEQTSPPKPQQGVNQTPIQNNNTNGGNNQSQELRSDLKKNENDNNKGNNTNHRIAIGTILIVIVVVSIVSYMIVMSNQKGQKQGRRNKGNASSFRKER